MGEVVIMATDEYAAGNYENYCQVELQIGQIIRLLDVDLAWMLICSLKNENDSQKGSLKSLGNYSELTKFSAVKRLKFFMAVPLKTAKNVNHKKKIAFKVQMRQSSNIQFTSLCKNI